MDALSHFPFFSLAPEIQLLVFEHLKGPNLATSQLVCKDFYSLSLDPSLKWNWYQTAVAFFAKHKDPLTCLIGFLQLARLPHLPDKIKQEAYQQALSSISTDIPRDALRKIAFRFIQEGNSQPPNRRELADLLFNKAESIFNELIAVRTSADIAFGFLALAAAKMNTNPDDVWQHVFKASEQPYVFDIGVDDCFSTIILAQAARINRQLAQYQEWAQSTASLASLVDIGKGPMAQPYYKETSFWLRASGYQELAEQTQQKAPLLYDVSRETWVATIDVDLEQAGYLFLYSQMNALIYNLEQKPFCIDAAIEKSMHSIITIIKKVQGVVSEQLH